MTVSEGEGIRTLMVRTRPLVSAVIGFVGLALVGVSALSHWNAAALGLGALDLLAFLFTLSRKELTFDGPNREVVNRMRLGPINWAKRYPFDSFALVVIGDPQYAANMNRTSPNSMPLAPR